MDLYDDIFRLLRGSSSVAKKLQGGVRPIRGLGSFHQELWTAFQSLVDVFPDKIATVEGLALGFDATEGAICFVANACCSVKSPFFILAS